MTRLPQPDRWEDLQTAVGGRVLAVEAPLEACQVDPADDRCAAAIDLHRNPYALQDHPGAFQTTGWFGAFDSQPSALAVAAESAADIAAAVVFARRHDQRLVIKGCGHDYLGRSSDPDALCLWTHGMRAVSLVPGTRDGSSATMDDAPVLTVGAGTRWAEAYDALKGTGRFVVGGGCLSVGAAGGFVQGGGYSSWSRRFGSAAGNVLEMEVVTADGRVVTCDAHHHPDLFWALRGGGGGTFGVVTQVTYRTHPLPDALGAVAGTIRASDDLAYRQLIRAVVEVMPALGTPHWGEVIRFGPDNALEFALTTVGLTDDDARAVWGELFDWVEHHPHRFTSDVFVAHGSFEGFWNASWWNRVAPAMIRRDERDGQPDRQFWWSSHDPEVSQYVNAYRSRYLPVGLVTHSPHAAAQALFEASRHAGLAIHFNKGLHGAHPEALERDRATSVNPAVFDALGLIIVASHQLHVYPGLSGHEPDLDVGAAGSEAVRRGMDVLHSATPRAGTYVNESDYFEEDWQESYWGTNYRELLEVKRRWDPDNCFRVHHGVGSEGSPAD